MREKAKVTNRRNVDDLKGAVRKAEGLLEIFALMLESVKFSVSMGKILL